MAQPKSKVKYNRHISFDDLSPSFLDEEIRLIKTNDRHIGFNNKYIHIPPQYNPLYQHQQSRPTLHDGMTVKSQMEIEQFKFAKGNKNNNQNLITKGIASQQQQRSRSESPFGRRTIKDIKNIHDLTRRLPPPPEVSILKKIERAPDEQQYIENVDISNMNTTLEEKMVSKTKQNTQLNSGSKSGYTQSLFANLNEVEDRISKEKSSLQNDNNDNNANRPSNKSRKKSFANMTNEELAQLEDLYASRGRSTTSKIEDYDFTQKNTIFSDPNMFSTKASQDTKLAQANKEIADTLAVTYPSRPMVNHRAISMTVQNYKFRSYVTTVQSKIPIADKKERRSSLRVVNCYISGKRYTWSAVDWYVENLAKDGDHLVIVTSIPNFEQKIDSILYSEKRKNKTENINRYMNENYQYSDPNSVVSSRRNSDSGVASNNSIQTKDSPMSKGVRLEAIYKEARDATRSILEYYAGRLQGKVVKITVELVKSDSIKDVITQTSALYKPHVQVVSTVSTNIQIKFRNGNVKLPFFMMKYYPMPSFIVPFEFIHPKKLTEDSVTIEKCVNKSNKLKWLDETINNTLYNPFVTGHPNHHHQQKQHDDEDERYARDSDGDSDAESVTSIADYFPVDPKVQKNIALFEELGYVIPKTSREILMEEGTDIVFDKDGKKLTPVTSRSSRRSSRVQVGGAANNLYKVKSLITDDMTSNYTEDSELASQTSSTIRKIKSMGSPSQRLSPINSHHNIPVNKSYGRKSNGSIPLTKYKTVDPVSTTKKQHHQHHQHYNSANLSSPFGSSNSPIPGTPLSAQNSNTVKKNKKKIIRTASSDEDKKKKKKSGFGSMLGKFFK